MIIKIQIIRDSGSIILEAIHTVEEETRYEVPLGIPIVENDVRLFGYKIIPHVIIDKEISQKITE